MFAPIMFWLFLLFGGPAESAEQIAARAGVSCDHGCLVAEDGWVYEVNRADLTWTARMANCEVLYADSDEARATMWTLVQNFYRRHLAGIDETFASFVTSYSACTSKRWSSAGTIYSSRITPLADRNRRTRWRDIPQAKRDLVLSFFRGEIANRWPGYAIIWTAGYEHHAAHNLAGPYYIEPADCGHSRNAYYKHPDTADFLPWTVRVVPSTEIIE